MKSKASKERRTWQRAKSKYICDTLRGLAALESVPVPTGTNDVGLLRNQLSWRLGRFTVANVIASAAKEYLANNPKPL